MLVFYSFRFLDTLFETGRSVLLGSLDYILGVLHFNCQGPFFLLYKDGDDVWLAGHYFFLWQAGFLVIPTCILFLKLCLLDWCFPV